MQESQHNFRIDIRLESYQPFFDVNWADQLFGIVDQTKLNSVAFGLVQNWHGLSRARALPWLLAKISDESLKERFEESAPFERRKIQAICSKLVGRLRESGERIRPMFFSKLQSCVEELDAEATNAFLKAQDRISSNLPEVWPKFLEDKLFAATLWSLERVCYGAVYYNYEAFLTQCMRIKLANPDFRINRHSEFVNSFRSVFGSTIEVSCWSDPDVTVARNIRHALLHNGGRMTKQLEQFRNRLAVEDDEIQIMATHTTALFELLKTKVIQLAQIAATIPEFA